MSTARIKKYFQKKIHYTRIPEENLEIGDDVWEYIIGFVDDETWSTISFVNKNLRHVFLTKAIPSAEIKNCTDMLNRKQLLSLTIAKTEQESKDDDMCNWLLLLFWILMSGSIEGFFIFKLLTLSEKSSMIINNLKDIFARFNDTCSDILRPDSRDGCQARISLHDEDTDGDFYDLSMTKPCKELCGQLLNTINSTDNYQGGAIILGFVFLLIITVITSKFGFKKNDEYKSNLNSLKDVSEKLKDLRLSICNAPKTKSRETDIELEEIKVESDDIKSLVYMTP